MKGYREILGAVGGGEGGRSIVSDETVPEKDRNVQLEHFRNRPEPLLELRNLLEVVSKLNHHPRRIVSPSSKAREEKLGAYLDDGSRQEHAGGVHDEPTVLEEVEIGGDEEEIGATLDGQEPTPGDVDAVGVPARRVG